jgi:hypothetical protein
MFGRNKASNSFFVSKLSDADAVCNTAFLRTEKLVEEANRKGLLHSGMTASSIQKMTGEELLKQLELSLLEIEQFQERMSIKISKKELMKLNKMYKSTFANISNYLFEEARKNINRYCGESFNHSVTNDAYANNVYSNISNRIDRVITEIELKNRIKKGNSSFIRDWIIQISVALISAVLVGGISLYIHYDDKDSTASAKILYLDIKGTYEKVEFLRRSEIRGVDAVPLANYIYTYNNELKEIEDELDSDEYQDIDKFYKNLQTAEQIRKKYWDAKSEKERLALSYDFNLALNMVYESYELIQLDKTIAKLGEISGLEK